MRGRSALAPIAALVMSLAGCQDAPRANEPPRAAEPAGSGAPARGTEPAAASGPAASCPATAEAVGAAAQRPVARDNARDLTGVLAAYTDDVVWLPPTGDIVSGKDALRARYRTMFQDNAIQLSSEVSEWRAGGGIAWARGYVLGALKPERGGPPVVVNDKFVALLRCEAGEWRISHLMWSPRGGKP